MRKWTDVALFTAVALGSSWLFALPLWLGDGLGSPLFPAVAAAMMFTPTLGLLAVWAYRRVGFRQLAEETGLLLGNRRRTFGLLAAAWFGPPLLSVLAVGISAALGLFTLDLTDYSLFRSALPQLPVPVEALLFGQLVSMVLIGPLLNSVLAFGEEWGWRGWLLPRLTSLGVLPALLLSGLIWGIWHAPLTLMGYNYPSLGVWAAPMFTAFCVIFGVAIGWLRLYSGSVWPAVLAHGSLNSSAGLPMLIGDVDAPPNLVIVGLAGLPGLVLLALTGVALVRWRPVTPQQA